MGRQKERACSLCGCTETRACIDPQTGCGCAWVPSRPDVCTACVQNPMARALDILRQPRLRIHKGTSKPNAAALHRAMATYRKEILQALQIAVQLRRLSELLITTPQHKRDSEIGQALRGILDGRSF